MISNIDRSVGAIIDRLEKLGISDNTLIIFSSDNGPTPEGGGDIEFFDSNSIYRGYKRDLYEGGIRMPTLARWPGRIQPGSRSDHVSTFWDLMPTLADLEAQFHQTMMDCLSCQPYCRQRDKNNIKVSTGNSTIHEEATRKQSDFWMNLPKAGKPYACIMKVPTQKPFSNCMT